MKKEQWVVPFALMVMLAVGSASWGQNTPYIGLTYPAGGQQGTTVRVRLGGQRIDGVRGAVISGSGVKAELVQYLRKLNPQDVQLMREQVRELRKGPKKKDPKTLAMIARIDKRMKEYVNRPACAALAYIAIVDVTIAADAEPGPREIRLITARGITNPMVFHVGQLPEVTRKPMKTATFQVLGKEALALRKRPEEEVEQTIAVPCTMNGQIASGEINRYRFQATKGQRLVVVVSARQLIPYIADAVPGWFQPVIALYDGQGKEVAFDDDYRFRPDPVLFYEVPKTGEYVLAINDAIYRGREDFVYRISVGELPFITSHFPLGGPAGQSVDVEIDGWNLTRGRMTIHGQAAGFRPTYSSTRNGRLVSNEIPFARDTLPEGIDHGSNDDLAHAQTIKMPMIVNGRIDAPGDRDVYRISGRAGEIVVAEVTARRLDSPVDSFVKLTNKAGKVLAMNDDFEDIGSGLNTHHADSYLTFKLPSDGPYFVHLTDTARNGGAEYGYRLRLSHPRADFELRAVPSSVALRSRGSASITVHAIRKDGFTGPITITLRNPPEGVAMRAVTLPAGKSLVKARVSTKLATSPKPLNLVVEGTAKIDGRRVSHDAVPADDRMQAFLWRHLVPAEELAAMIYNPAYKPPVKRVHPPKTAKKPAEKDGPPPQVKFTKRQVANRLRQIELLYQEGLITDEFNDRKVAECEAVK